MDYFKTLAVAGLMVFMTPQVNARKAEKPSTVKRWSKPASVFGSFNPARIPYSRRYGRSLTMLSARGGTPRERFKSLGKMRFYGKRRLNMSSTAYLNVGNRTATGLYAGRGAIAVDPRVIPLGTYLYVEGYGYGFACDTGGKIKGNIVDLLFTSRSAAIQWGRRPVKVWVLGAK